MSAWRDMVRDRLVAYHKKTNEDIVDTDHVYDIVLPTARETFPNNDHPKGQIRQKLQELQAANELKNVERGRYNIKKLAESTSPTDTEETGSSQYLVPLDDDERRAYNQIVNSAVDPNRLDDVPALLHTAGTIRFWAFDERAPISSLQSGDTLIFVHDDRYLGQGTVDSVVEDSTVGEWFWTDPNRCEIVLLREHDTESPFEATHSNDVELPPTEPSISIVPLHSEAHN